MPLTQTQRPLYEVKANLFKGLAHPLRIRILELLSAAPEVSVADLQRETELEASHLSQHLAVLRRYRLVVSERRGSHVHYRLADPRTAELLAVARALLLNLVAEDGERLSEAQALPGLPAQPARPAASA
ncbi:ArsR/SmtB family transcription factor [Brachybacterium sp. UNK5269]|uniref:ArsR/SmtB family transcription factor n=1 Tax=Brachybacterium sp. UNK5269 TaxID=3408576 RepID=UPI003BB022E0